MKRTTYIMIGMLVTVWQWYADSMFYVVDRNVTQKDNLWKSAENGKRCSCPRAGC